MTPLSMASHGETSVDPATAHVASDAAGGQGPDHKRAFVHQLFTAIAPRYDWFNRLASLSLDQRWRRATVTMGQLRTGMVVLDVCTGSGDLALLCARQLHGQGRVCGLDFTEAMLRAARRKHAAHAAPIQWLRADAQALPFQAESFDRVFIGFSTRNLSDLGLGLREMIRVLKRGGQLLILETGYPAHPALRAAYQAFLLTIARTIGWALTGRAWPFTYLARSVKGFLRPDQVVSLLNASGASARYLPLTRGLASLYIADKP